jgi:hypothetical protein
VLAEGPRPAAMRLGSSSLSASMQCARVDGLRVGVLGLLTATRFWFLVARRARTDVGPRRCGVSTFSKMLTFSSANDVLGSYNCTTVSSQGHHLLLGHRAPGCDHSSAPSTTMSSGKHLLNTPESLVVDSLNGLCTVNPQLSLDEARRGEHAW